MKNVTYLPYSFPSTQPFFHWGKKTYSPPVTDTALHYHNCLEIGYCEEGSGRFLLENKIFPFSKGDYSLIFPEQIHIAHSNPFAISSWHFVMIDLDGLLANLHYKGLTTPDSIKKEQIPKDFPSVFCAQNQPKLSEFIRLILQETLGNGSANAFSMIGLCTALFSALFELCPPLPCIIPPKTTDFHYSLLAPALVFISNNLDSPLSVPDLAQRCSLSESTFRRYFHEIFHMSPMDFIYQSKMKIASQLLYDKSRPIAQVSLDVGYASLSSFNRHFKKYMGISPRQWRDR